MADDPTVKTWHNRIAAAEKLRETWEERRRVQDCYNYWNGDQLNDPFDRQNERRAQVNKIWGDVRKNLPALYFNRPFIRLTAAPELANDPGTQIERDTQILQDTVNHLIRQRSVGFCENTNLALLEAQWSMGCVEVGYSASFLDTPYAERPALKEKKDTEVGEKDVGGKDKYGLDVDEYAEDDDIEVEIRRLKNSMTERFFVKHIPAGQFLCSASDQPILENNDWVGYYEDVNLSDVKRTKAYENTSNLKAVVPGRDRRDGGGQSDEHEDAESQKVRLYKLWDLRRKRKLVIAEGHQQYLYNKPFKRTQLFPLRFDVDPRHFWPRPPILNKLGVQDEYNQSREFLRLTRKGRVPRFTFDEMAVDADDMKKLESGEHGAYIARKAGTPENSVSPINQPNLSDSAVQSLTLSDKEFDDVGGVGGDSSVSREASATQAKISDAKNQVKEDFDREIVAKWLASIADELLRCAIEKMSLDQFVRVNIAPDNMMMQELSMEVAGTFQRVNAEVLSEAQTGIEWQVVVDIESLSPVTQEMSWAKWQQALGLLANPPLQELFAVSPELFKMTLDKMGIRSGRDQELIVGSLQQLVNQRMQMMQQQQLASGGGSAPSQPGVSPQAAASQPGQPKPGGPQPGGPPGPGASIPQ